MYKKGLNVSVNSDDPPMFGANITGELLLLHEKLNYPMKDLVALTKKAIGASFLENAQKKIYAEIIDDYLNHLL